MKALLAHLDPRSARLPASLFIAAVLLLQAIAAADFNIFGLIRRAPYLWPFMDYPMYSPARYDGDVIEQFRVFATFDDGAEAEVAPEDAGLDFWLFLSRLVPAIEAGDGAALASYMDVYERGRGRRPTALRLELHPRIVRRDGLHDGAMRVLAEAPVPDGGAAP